MAVTAMTAPLHSAAALSRSASRIAATVAAVAPRVPEAASGLLLCGCCGCSRHHHHFVVPAALQATAPPQLSRATSSSGRGRRGFVSYSQSWADSTNSDGPTEFEHRFDNAARYHLPRPGPGGFARGSFIGWRRKDRIENGESQELQDLYELGPKVGEGGFGVVHQATHKETGEVVAIKSILNSKIRNPEELQGEIEFLKVADHPNVIRYYETFQDDERNYLVMEMCTGGSLSDLIKSWHDKVAPPIKEVDLGRIVVQMLRGLAYCHRHSIVHRDVKPKNFLFGCGKPTKDSLVPIACSGDADAPLKLLDFGISGVVSRDNPHKRLLTRRAGTDGYMAPEVLLGQPYGPAADLFSVGAVIHKMITGVNLQWDPEKVGYKFPGKVRWSTLSSECRSLLERLLSTDPNDRPTAAEAIEDPWLQAMGLSSNQGVSREYLSQCIRSMAAFCGKSKLRRSTVYSTVAFAPLHSHQMEMLRLAFLATDREHGGSVSFSDFSKLASQSGLSEKDTIALFSCVDASKTNDISYSEWLAATAPPDWFRNPHHAQRAFDTLDIDRNGLICAGDICHLLPDVFDLEELKEEILRIFPDSDGHISFKDFCFLISEDGCARQCKPCT